LHRLKVHEKNRYKGGGLRANGQGILDPIASVIWPRYAMIGYVPKYVAKISITVREEDPRTVTMTPVVNSSLGDEIDLVKAESTTSNDR
jgi:hypothetical protein